MNKPAFALLRKYADTSAESVAVVMDVVLSVTMLSGEPVPASWNNSKYAALDALVVSRFTYSVAVDVVESLYLIAVGSK